MSSIGIGCTATYSDEYEAYEAGDYWYKIEGGPKYWHVSRFNGPPIGSIQNIDIPKVNDQTFTSKEEAHKTAAKWAQSWKANQS